MFFLRFWFENSSFRIDIAEIEEAYIFDYVNIERDKNQIETLIKIILTHKLKIQNCGKYQEATFLSPYTDQTIIINRKHSLLSLFGIKWKCLTKEFNPIYFPCPHTILDGDAYENNETQLTSKVK